MYDQEKRHRYFMRCRLVKNTVMKHSYSDVLRTSLAILTQLKSLTANIDSGGTLWARRYKAVLVGCTFHWVAVAV
jgi:hypothetical protein